MLLDAFDCEMILKAETELAETMMPHLKHVLENANLILEVPHLVS